MGVSEQLAIGYMVLVVVVNLVALLVLFSPISFQTMPPSWEISYEVTGDPPSFSGGVHLMSTLSVSSLPSLRTADATSVVGGPGTFCSPCGAAGSGGGRPKVSQDRAERNTNRASRQRSTACNARPAGRIHSIVAAQSQGGGLLASVWIMGCSGRVL